MLLILLEKINSTYIYFIPFDVNIPSEKTRYAAAMDDVRKKHLTSYDSPDEYFEADKIYKVAVQLKTILPILYDKKELVFFN